jgi:hypothetical protein
MTSYRIDYIAKPNAFGRIQAVGGSYPVPWRDTEDNVIGLIAAGTTFFVQQGIYRADVGVEWGHSPPFLKTVPDNTKLDNLLSLPNVA